jgi:hypothetical protein
MENETTPVPELYTAVPGDMDGAPVPELINEMPVDGMPVPELYMDDIDMDAMEDYMEMQGMPMDDYYNSSYPTASADGTGLAILATGTMMFMMLLSFGILVLMIVSMWKIFTKAGEEGWKSIIPFYNTWVLLEISGKPGWWLFLMFIPFVNIIILIIMYNGLSKSFGKGLGYLIGLLLLSPIFFPMLAFGKATYTKPVEGGGANIPPQDIPPQNPTSTQTPPTQNIPNQTV